jgi:hypothetical protein
MEIIILGRSIEIRCIYYVGKMKFLNIKAAGSHNKHREWKSLSKFVVLFEDGKEVNKERDANHLNSLRSFHTLHAKDTQKCSLHLILYRGRDTHWIGSLMHLKSRSWIMAKFNYWTQGYVLHNIFVHANLRFVVIVVYCHFPESSREYYPNCSLFCRSPNR